MLLIFTDTLLSQIKITKTITKSKIKTTYKISRMLWVAFVFIYLYIPTFYFLLCILLNAFLFYYFLIMGVG